MRQRRLSTIPPAEHDDYDACVRHLAVPHRRKEALRRLMAAGAQATPALRRGLAHEDAAVRVGCCQVLDHYMDEDALPELIANLRHPDAGVRAWSMHALVCDRCKEGTCKPGEDDVVPIALDMLANDPSRRVRTMAAHLIGEAVHRRPAAVAALERARVEDAHTMVRKVAAWYVPGGPRYERLKPRARA